MAKETKFSFLKYCNKIEGLMQSWYDHNCEVLQHSSNLGSVREHFVKHILANFLPKGVMVGSGEIINRDGDRTGQQDIIIYRSDFPVITSLTSINTYLSEGVVATIEVKSNLRTGSPRGLYSAFGSVQRVLKVGGPKQALIRKGSQAQSNKLLEMVQLRTYVLGYAGWIKESALLDQYLIAMKKSNGTVPHLVYMPGFCIIRDDGLINPESYDKEKPPGFLIHKEDQDYKGGAFAVFLHHFLKGVMYHTGGASVMFPGFDVELEYDLGPYFNFANPGTGDPGLRFDRFTLSSTSTLK
jgi:hypothetical protein